MCLSWPPSESPYLFPPPTVTQTQDSQGAMVAEVATTDENPGQVQD